MDIKKRWEKLKDWQKGGVVGGIIGLFVSLPLIDFLFKIEFFKKYFLDQYSV